MATPRTPSPTAGDRVGRLLDPLLHPVHWRDLARATRRFRDQGVIRVYPNDARGRRLEAVEVAILWHHGYRPPVRIVRDAIWSVGGPTITIGFNRERVPAFLGEQARRVAQERGVLERD